MNSFWWAVITSLVWGFVPILEKIGLAKVAPLPGLFYRSIGVMLGLVILWLFMVKPAELRSVDLKTALMVMLAGFLASFVAQIFFYTSLKSGDVSKVVPISGSYPLITFLLGVMILGEAVTPLKLLGVAFVITGIWFLR